jgi:uncharacterized membrane protein YphA (DoxX/SURF4 family)
MSLYSFVDAHPIAFRRLALVLRLVIGAVLIASGLIKALDDRAFMITALRSFGVPGQIYPLLALMAPLELMTGIALVLGFSPKVNTRLVMILLLLFSVGLLVALRKGNVQDCGCFGAYVPMRPTSALIRNMLLMTGTGLVYIVHRHDATRWKTWQVAILLTAACLGGAAAGWSRHEPFVDQSILRTGRVFPTWGFKGPKPPIEKGEAIVVFFHPKCSHCWNAASNLKAYLGHANRPIIGITSADDQAIDEFRKKLDLPLPVYQVTKDYERKAVFDYPTFVLLKDQKILFKVEKEVPSLRTLEELILPSLADKKD